MKKAILFIAMLVAATTAVRGQISYGAPNDWFVTVWDMSKPTNRTAGNPASTISVPILGSNYTLYWEDVNNASSNGIVNVTSSSGSSPYYLTVPSATGKYRLKAYKGVGTLTRFGNGSSSSIDYNRLMAVEQWGTTVWSSFRWAFSGCSNMDVTATDIPNLSACQDVSYMFYNCTSLVNGNGSISGWQTANVTDMSGMFAGATSFNKPLTWNTQSVTNMSAMFQQATSFNSALNFNTQNVTNMLQMFFLATSFNQPLTWNTQSVTNMQSMFSRATSFNQPLTWNTQSVTNMRGMFAGATSFNSALNFNTQSVTDMGSMFSGATLFNSVLNFNTQSVTNMSGMFLNATAFNKPLNWNTQNVTDMSTMFQRATSFNQDLSGWDISKVTNMSGMFSGATSFNGDVNSWGNKMKNVTNINVMFYGATSFNQSLDKWVLSRTNNTNNTFRYAGISCNNLRLTLEGWARNNEYISFPVEYTPNISLYFSSQYSYRIRKLVEYLRKYKGIWIYTEGQYVADCDGVVDSTSYIIEIDSRRNAVGAATPTNTSVNINVVGTNFSVRYTEISNLSNTGTVTGLNTGSTISLPSPGAYTIAVYAPVGGSITSLSTTTAPLTNGYITNVTQWGTTKWQSLKDAFRGCTGISSLLTVDKPDLSECTSFDAMFENCTGLFFIPSIEEWNLSNVTSLKSMFAGATSFNQPLNDLDVSHIADFSSMFSGATAFDRPLGNWNLSGITDGNTAMLNMFDNSGLSCLSYHATLSDWSAKPSTPSNIRLGVANVNYNNATVAIRNSLQTGKAWNFVGDQLSAGCDGTDASGRFITVWDTRMPNGNGLFSLDIRTNMKGGAIIDWEEVGNPSNHGTLTTSNGDVTGLPHAGVYRLKATISHSNANLHMYSYSTDENRLLYVEQWGNTVWKDLNEAFSRAKNMKVIATDIPNLSQLVNSYYSGGMAGMFSSCSSLITVPNINSWNIPSTVTFLNNMFADAKLFNQDISNWDVSHVTNMSGMFKGASSFNQDLSNWDVSHVTEMSYMFKEASSFNSPLNWGSKVSSVINMTGMFKGATSFNQDISGWDVSHVTSMGQSSGNNDGMFQEATSFNQDISAWNVANVQNFTFMFRDATSFNQNLGAWKLANALDVYDIFVGSGMSCENYSATLAGWAAQPESWHNVNTVEPHYSLNRLQKYNAQGLAARTLLKSKGWQFVGDGGYYTPNCEDVDFFETTWSVPKDNGHHWPPIDTLAINAIGTNFTVIYEVTDSTQNPPRKIIDVDDAVNASIGSPYTLLSHLYGSVQKASVPGMVKVKVYPGNGTLTGLNMRGVDPGKLVSIDHWGNNKWQRLDSAFIGCEHMELKATDVPDLSQVTGADGLKYMFWGCMAMTDLHDKIGTWDVSTIKNTAGMFGMASAFNRNIGSWDVSNVTDMSSMFIRAATFNQPIGGWNVSKVTNMSSMFARTDAFNQPIGSWNVGAVTNMSGMFDDAKAFNKPLNDWNVSKVTNMNLMFNTAIAFNQPLDRWDVRKATSMGAMFYGATAFDQPLGKWKPFSSTMMGEMFGHSGMSCANYSGTLYGWAQNVDSLKPNVLMTLQHNMKYNRRGKYARNKITTAKNWTFGQDTEDLTCGLGMPFPTDYVSEWDLSQPAQGTRPDAATTLKTNLWGTNFVVEWLNLNDGTTGAATVTTTTEPYTITGLTAGKRYRVIAYADPSNPSSTLSKLSTMAGGSYSTDAKRLDSVTQWGTNRWTSLEGAFRNCIRMNVTATDVPNLHGVNDLSNMFHDCDSLVYNPTINTWRTDSITNMRDMFGESPKFNQPLGSWNTAKVTDMHGMFQGAHNFDQDIHNWNTGKVTDMSQMFLRAFKFNQPIGSWNTANVTNMAYMFAFATSFNKPLYWNVEKVTNMTSMFWGADAFDQDLSYWTLKNVTSAGNMFKANLNKGMSCGNYSETLQGWAINPLTKTGLNFLAQDNRQYNMIGKESRDILTKPIANGGKGWIISGDTYDKNCGIDYVWTGAVSTNIADNGNWQGGQHPGSSPILGEFRATVAFDSLAVRDMHIPSLPYTPPGSTPNYIHFYSFGNLINNSNKKVVIEPNGHLHINKWVFGSSTPADVDKIVIKADDTNPNGSLILAGQPCDKPVYATVEMYSKAGREATAMTWTDNIPSSPTKDSLFSVHYRWQYIGIPVAGEYANAFYGSYLRKYDETYNDPNHYYGKWRKLGANETWQPLVPFAGYEVTSRTPKVYVFKGRLLHCPQELTLTRQAAEVSAVPSSFTDPRERRWELGHNVFGNSYTSALMIGQGKLFVDLEGRYPLGQEPIEGTVYVYNTGSIADWAGGTTLGSGAGQYVAVPVFSATALSEQYISSMQGFMLKFKEDTLRINGVGSPVKFRIGLNKEEHYLSNIYPFGGNQRPQRAPQADPSDKIHGYLKVGLTSRRSISSVHLIEAEGTTDEFDNGWDGMQLNTGRSSSATLFVPSEYGDLQVSTSDNIVGDRFGIVNNGDTTYRLTVIRHRLDNHGELYLYDVATNRYTLLDTDTTVYDFTSEGSGNVDKRFVITDRRNADDPNTAVDEAAEDMSLYGYVDGRHTLVVNNHTAEAGTLTLLDVSGKAVYTSPFGVGFSRHDLSHLPAGVYIARLEASTRRATVKAITMK